MTVNSAKNIIRLRGDKIPRPGQEVLIRVDGRTATILRNYSRTLRVIQEQRS